MSYFAITPNLIATGTIAVASFVKGDPASDEAVVQSGLGDTAIGVSYPGINAAPGTPGAGTAAAVSGQACTTYGPGSIVEVQVGAAGITRGFVSPDALGLAINASPGGFATAFSFENGNAGEFVRMMVLPPGTVGTGGAAQSNAAVNATLTAAQSGTTINVTASDLVITTPAGVPGMKYRVLVTTTAAASGGTVGTTLHVPGTDTLGGNGFTPAAGKGAVNTDGTAAAGNWIEITCISANTWLVTGINGTWAREA